MTKVFLDYDQKSLDEAYDQAVYAPNRDQVLARLAHTSELVRRRLGPAERFAYGETSIEGEASELGLGTPASGARAQAAASSSTPIIADAQPLLTLLYARV